MPDSPPAAPSLGTTLAIPGAYYVDHAGFTVPDLAQAVAFFCDVLGAAVLWHSAPFSADGTQPKAPAGTNADPQAACQLAMLRLGPTLNVELIEYRLPGPPAPVPLSSALGVGHLAFAVEDMQLAGAYLQAHAVRMLEGPRLNHNGPNAGQVSWFFLSPWGMAVELVQRPKHLPYEADTPARLFELPR